MAEAGAGDSSSPDTDRDFVPSADLLVHDFDDEGTMEEEENVSGDSGDNEELDDLQKESDMPLEDVLAMYYGSNNDAIGSETNETSGSTSEEEILNNHDLTLDKEQVARDVLGHDGHRLSTTFNEPVENVDSSATSCLLNGSFGEEDGSFDGEDGDYFPLFDEEVWKKSIQVGDEFQANIPDLITDSSGASESTTNTVEERKLWDPTVLDESEVTRYLGELATSGKPEPIELPEGVQARDDEQALYTLLQSDFNVEEAVRRKKLQITPPTDPLSLWSEDECQNFESGLRVYGKNFFAIHHNKVRTRSVGELVQFYYFWKRTERREAFCSRGRLERKRLATPGITDYADRFMDKQDSEDDESTQSMPVDCSCSTPEALSADGLPPAETTPDMDTAPDEPASTATLENISTNVTSVVSLDNSTAEKRAHTDATKQETAYNNDNSLQLGSSSPKRLKVEPPAVTTQVGN